MNPTIQYDKKGTIQQNIDTHEFHLSHSYNNHEKCQQMHELPDLSNKYTAGTISLGTTGPVM